MSVKLMKEALESCEAFLLSAGFESSDVYAEICNAIEQAEKQEPGYTTTRNAWTGRVTYKCNVCGKDDFRSDHAAKFHVHACQAPAVQTKQWASLTQTEIDNLELIAATKADIRDIEAKLKEKNHVD